MDNEYLDIIGLGIFKALNDKRYPILVNGKISESAIPTSITNSITSILSLIPDAASSENKLADKNFVNSSIATNTATFRGTFDDLATLQATSADINDYAFYVHTDEIGNTAYDRYKHNGSNWVFEYTLNNSSFTAEQWSAINSGITTTKVGNYDAHLINYSNPHKVTKSQVGLGNVENVALSSWAGSNKITTLGTITKGVWNGSKIGNDYLANSSITIGTTAISLGSTAKSLAGIEKLQLNDANSNLVYDSTTGSWKLTGNLLVTGFISAGAKGNSSSGGGSTYTQREWAEIKIMSASEIGLLASAYSVKEAYNELNTAIETLAGKATNVKFTQTLTSGKQIGSISIDGKSTSLFAPANYAWSEVTGKPSFATVATSGSYSDLTNKPTIASLMGSAAIGGTSSFIYWNGSAWATKALGSNAFTSISKVSQLTNDSGYITGITKAMVEGVLTGNITSHTHSYLPLSGGTMSNTNVVTNLNADLLDGYHASSFAKVASANNLISFGNEFNFIPSAFAGEVHINYRTPTGTDGAITKYNFDNGAGGLLATISQGQFSGNAATATNADKLDGYHAEQVLTSDMSSTVDLNEISVPSIYRLSNVNPNLPSTIFNYGNLLTVKYVNADTAWQLLGAYSSDNLWFRRGSWKYDGTGTLRTNAWKAIAFTDSNVASSSKWATPRTITLTGSVTGSVSIDGSQNVSLATTTNHTHTFDSITSKPTTISGYGITDAYTKTQTDTKYLQVAGGTITGSLTVNGLSYFHKRVSIRSGSAIDFYDADGNNRGILVPYSANNYDLSFYDTTAWRTLLHSGNYNSYALPLSGGTLTGSVTMLGMNTNLIRNITYTSTSSWARPLITLQVDGVNKFGVSALGDYTAGASDNGIVYGYIGCNSYNGLNLRISATSLSWGDSPILHSGNYNSYAPKLDGTGASGTWGINISGNAATATNADKLDGFHESDFSRHITGTTSTTGTKYFKLGNLPKSNNATWDAFLIQGEIGGWASLQKTVLNVCVGRRNGVAFCGYTQGLWNRNLGIDIGVNDAGEIVLIVTGQYCAWTLDLHAIQGTISYTGTTFTPTDTNFVLLSASNYVSKSLVDGTVEKATKLATSRTIWGQSFDGTGNVSGIPSFPSIIDINRTQTGVIPDSSKIGFEIETFANDVRLKTYSASGGNPTHLVLTSSGNVGIGTISPAYKLHIVGALYSSAGLITDGAISAAKTSTSSDIRLKDNISEIGSKTALQRLLMLKPKSWTWNDKAGVTGQSMGFVAQDVEGILPQMVKKQDNGYLSLDYTQLHALEVSALQSHEKRIEELERENKILKEEINKLKQYAN